MAYQKNIQKSIKDDENFKSSYLYKTININEQEKDSNFLSDPFFSPEITLKMM